MRTIQLYDTLRREVRPLAPRDAGPPAQVGIYACGPTVYSRVHVGNARPYVVFSLFVRFLRHEGYDAVLVANVTDINDKIYDAARVAGRPSDELAREMTAHYVAVGRVGVILVEQRGDQRLDLVDHLRRERLGVRSAQPDPVGVLAVERRHLRRQVP